MRNLKKGLALVLVLAMAASTFVTGAFNDVAKDHTNATAVGVLNDLGVLTGKTETTFAPAATLTRAEAAAVIYRLLSGKTNADNFAGATNFTDVAASFWGAGFVNFCVSEGIIMGYPDKSFKPDAPVTYAEFITMLVRAAGLEEKRTISKIDDNGNVVEATVVDTKYPSGYIAIGAKNGMNDDVNLMANDAADRGNVAQMAYNTLFNTVTSSGKTLAEAVFKVKYAYGTLTGDNDGVPTGTFTDAKTGGNAVSFDGKKKFDIKDELIGLNVKIMFKEPTTGSKEIVSIVAVDNTIYEVAAKDLTVNSATSVTFKVNGKDKTFAIDAAPTEIVNGVAKAIGLTSADTKKNIPTVYTFVDFENDNEFDVVKAEVKKLGKVSTVTAKSVTVDIGGTFKTFDLESDDVKAPALKENDRVATYIKEEAANKVSNGTLVLVEKQTGFVSANDGSKYTIGGTVYTAAEGVTVTIGKTIEFYVVNGFVMETKVTSESGKYAYVTAADLELGTGKVKAYLADGTNGIFEVDSNSALKVTAEDTIGAETLATNSMFTYGMTSAGKIKLEAKAGADIAVAPAADIASYTKDSKLINGAYIVDSSIVYVVDGTKVTVLKGQLPGFAVTATTAGAYKYAAVTEAKNGATQVKVAVVKKGTGTFSGVTSQSDIYGMVSGSPVVESTFEDGTAKYRVKMTVATEGDAAKTYYTAWVESTSDSVYTNAIGKAKGTIVKIDLTANGEVNDVTAPTADVSGKVVQSFVNNTLATGDVDASFAWTNEATKILASDVEIYQVTRKTDKTTFDSIAVAGTGALTKATLSGSVVYGCKVSYFLNSDSKVSVIFVDAQEVVAE